MTKLLPDFYIATHIENTNETEWIVQIKLNPLHPVYSGHFPQQPIVPGVCLLQIIKECAETICHTTLQYKQIASCKFLSAINPREIQELTFYFTITKNEGTTFQIQIEGKSSHETCIKLKAQLIKK